MKTTGFLRVLILALVLCAAFCRAQDATTDQSISLTATEKDFSSHFTLSSNCDLWLGPCQGLRNKAMSFEASLGAGWGIRDGSKVKHDLAIAELRVGRVISRLLGEGHFFQGNFVLLGEVFGGAQFHPQPSRYFIGAAPVIRYEFATGSRFSPFIDISAGVLATDIGRPDLGGIFEFNLQGGPGIKYYISKNAAVQFQYRYLHFSSAGIYHPNHGINVNTLLLGFAWGFK